MTMYSDLHIHSNFSDGVLSPAELVRRAVRRGLEYIAISDHDCLDGIASAIKTARKYDIKLIPAVELSAVEDDREFHILGYLYDYDNTRLTNLLSHLSRLREERIQNIIKKINQDGINLSYRSLRKKSKNGTIGRLHIAREMKDIGLVTGLQDAFKKYLAHGKKYFIPKMPFSIKEAIVAIHESGGIAVWAHPEKKRFLHYLKKMIEYEIDGLEAYHPGLSKIESKSILKAALAHDLLVTGGSDWHSVDRDGDFGSFKVRTENIRRFLEYYSST